MGKRFGLMKSVIGLERKTLTLFFVLLLGLLGVSGLISVLSARRIFQDQEWLVHTYRMKAEVMRVRERAVTAESQQRAYLLLPRPEALENFRRSQEEAREALSTLAKLASDNPRQIENVRVLNERFERRMARAEKILRRREDIGLEKLLAETKTAPGLAMMRAFEAAADQVDQEETRLLTARIAETRFSVWRTILAFVLSTAVGFGFLVAFNSLVRRYTDQQERAREAERALRMDLEREIADRERAQAAERRLLAELSRSNRELQDFAFVASHDLQEPLRKIQQFGDRLQRKDGERLSPDGLDSLERLQNASRRMQGLIHDLLAFSRVTSKAVPFVTVDLDRTVRTVVDDLESRIETSGGRVDVGHFGSIEADPTQMHQLFQNLIGNALKFGKPGVPPIVTVESFATEPDRLGVSVRDNGIGFDQKYAEKVFTIFQRLHGRSEYEGSGIGLAICRKIVERHAGTIEAISSPGQGAEFRIELPRRRSVTLTNEDEE